MKSNVEKIEKNRVELEVEVESEKFAEGVKKAYQKVAKNINIPGFRKGKAPKRVIENYIGGKEMLLNQAAEDTIPQAYLEAINENNLEPVDQPELELVQVEENKPLIFKAKVFVKPEVELGDYKGLTVEHKDFEVKPEEVENHLKSMQERHARLVSIEDRPVQKGDSTVIDFEGFIDGEPFAGGRGENYSLEIGSHSFIPGFEEQIEGMGLNEEKEIEVTFPEEYHQEDLAGKKATFKVKVNEIKKKELLPLDDEFAKDVSEFDTLVELKEDIEKKLEKNAKRASEEALKSKIILKAVENSEIEVPEVMVETRIDSYLNDLNQRLLYQGLNLEKYLEIINTTIEEFRKQYFDKALEEIKSDLVLEAITKKEGISLNDEEIEKEIERMANAYNQDKEKLKSLLEMRGTLDSLKNSIQIEKTIDFLVKESNVIEPKEDDAVEQE